MVTNASATPDVGELAPDFSAFNVHGASRRLAEPREQPATVLVFYRGHW